MQNNAQRPRRRREEADRSAGPNGRDRRNATRHGESEAGKTVAADAQRGGKRERRTGGGPPAPRVPAGRPLETMRIAKALARAGLCSRRDGERWIAEGRVRVNGKVIPSPALDVGPSDRIEVDGSPLPDAEPPRLWRYHKARGLVTTHRDPDGRQTVFEVLPKELGRVVSVGRLDFNTEGLLLLTNDGALARHMELPATGWLRRYRVRAHGRITQPGLDALKAGVEIEGVRYGPVEATLDQVQGANVWLTIGLREGKNREVRKILSTLGLEVNRLIRVSFGPFQLLDLPVGQVEPVKRRVLAEQLGPRLARELGLAGEPDTAPKTSSGRTQRFERRREARAARDDGHRTRKARSGEPT